ncbi:MAG: methyltransferase domain-containing protein [Leptolyngbyaceae cyanobacterium bins.302]|nr:methyltransferase domain-containing protein [Leptolyngbyaceae cyanobacterium bins.302]
MPASNALFDRFLVPVLRTFINQDDVAKQYQEIDWKAASARLSDPTLIYPDYYQQANFHGIEGGYLTVGAAVSYDPITQYALPPGESLVRQAAIATIHTQPRRILDLGCGTGSGTLLLKQRFPDAEVIGLDLSPYMLVVAEQKAQKAGVTIQWRHGLAEKTSFPDASFDLVTASLLFHETPVAIAKAILRECYRLLTVSGEVVILDGSQRVLRQADWLTHIFEEPYIREYAAGSMDAWMGSAGFGAVLTEDVWWLHQTTRGVKPLTHKVEFASPETSSDGAVGWALG